MFYMFIILHHVESLMFRHCPGQSYEGGGQHREDHRLDKAYQNLETKHANAQQQAYERHSYKQGQGLGCHKEYYAR